jgi:hypothetical protein
MRAVLAIVVGLACPLTAAAQTAGDRYGPASAARLNQVSAEAYQGRALSWANKQAVVQTAGVTLPQSPAPYRQQPTYAPFQPQTPLPLQARAVAAPPAQSQMQQPPQPQPAASIYMPPRQQQQQQQPAVQPAPPTQAQPQRVAAMVQPGMGGPTRLYSVHRGYGMTPDAIPEPPAGNRYVLIGPPDAPPGAKTDDDDAPDARPGAF